jgi:hypothetical protein
MPRVGMGAILICKLGFREPRNVISIVLVSVLGFFIYRNGKHSKS